MDFKPRSRDGMGDDWPITSEELAPYYDKVESYIGVFGTRGKHPEFSRRHFPAAAHTHLSGRWSHRHAQGFRGPCTVWSGTIVVRSAERAPVLILQRPAQSARLLFRDSARACRSPDPVPPRPYSRFVGRAAFIDRGVRVILRPQPHSFSFSNNPPRIAGSPSTIGG
jgi:choline dehydrogenase-like flavoprotein